MASIDPTRWQARTLDEVAFVLGIKRRQVSDYIARGCPGSPRAYFIPAIVEWVRSNVWKAKPAPVIVAGEDEALMAGDSPALERWREARAAMAELDLQERQGQLVRKEDVEWAFNNLGNYIRGAGQQLMRQFGNEVADAINEAVDSATEDLERRFGPQENGEQQP